MNIRFLTHLITNKSGKIINKSKKDIQDSEV